MDENTLTKVKEFVQRFHERGILLRDEPLDSEQAEAFAKRVLEGEEDAVRQLFYRTLSCNCMGIAKRENEREPYPLQSKIDRHNRSVRPILEQIVETGIPEEDVSRLIEHYQRWTRYEALFEFISVLESPGESLHRLLYELGYSDSEDGYEVIEALDLHWGLAKFDEDGNFLQAIDVAHDFVGPDDFFKA